MSDTLTMLTVKDVASAMRVSEDVALHWIATGQLRAINVTAGPKAKRQQYRVHAEDLKAFTEQRTYTPRLRLTPREQPKRVSLGPLVKFVH